jgi:hypothetical protein
LALGPGIRQLRLVLGEHALRLGLGRLGLHQVAADALGTGFHRLADGWKGELPQQEQQDEERKTTPDDLVHLGEDGVGGLLAVLGRLLHLVEELGVVDVAFEPLDLFDYAVADRLGSRSHRRDPDHKENGEYQPAHDRAHAHWDPCS